MNLPGIIPEPWRMASRLLAVSLVLIALYAVGRSHGAAAVRADWDAEKARQTQAALRAELAARQRERSFFQALEKANHDAAEREKTLRAAAATAAASAGQLRGTIADLERRLSGAPVDACRATAFAALDVFGDCTDQYRALAEAAYGHAIDVETLMSAWPK